MQFIAIETTMDWQNKRMDTIHSLLFHGHAIRADAPADPAMWGQGTWSHTVGDDLSHPLLLRRSGVYIPSIFKPGVALVVREDVYKRVDRFPGLMSAEVRPSKLINYWKPVGDFSFYESDDPLICRNMNRPDMLLDWMPNDPSLFASFPNCHELVAYNVYKYQGQEPRSIRVNFIMNNDTEKVVSFECPASIIDAYPLIWGMVCLVRRDLFDLLQSYIDHDHFAISPVNL